MFRMGVPLMLICCVLSVPAHAHKPSDSYLRISGSAGELAIEWDIALKDLEFLIGLDANQDGEITWGELKSQRDTIVAHALSKLRIAGDGRDCELKIADLLINQHSDGAYAVLAIETNCPADVALLEVNYELLFDLDPTHRGLVFFENDGIVNTHVLSPGTSNLAIRTYESGLWLAFASYVREGVWHIWIGYDHILFLVALLLPAVLEFRGQSWNSVAAFRPTCLTVLKIVTMFTLAHSITLWLAVMGYVELPSQWVEAAIAASIVVTALNNIWPILPLPNWTIAFFFGLVHGFGFANVLIDLGLSKASLAMSLLGFNVGVELGQIAIVLVILPLLYLMRDTMFYRRWVFQYGSMLVAALGSFWMVERVFHVTLI